MNIKEGNHIPTEKPQEEKEMTKTIVSLASEISAALETITRNDGSKCIRFKDGSPYWMSDVALEAHGDMYPDDERYRLFEKVVYTIAELDDDTDDEDVMDNLYDDLQELVDIYNSDLLKWVSSHSNRPCYVDDAVQELGYADFFSALQLGQFEELNEIAGLTIYALQVIVKEEDND